MGNLCSTLIECRISHLKIFVRVGALVEEINEEEGVSERYGFLIVGTFIVLKFYLVKIRISFYIVALLDNHFIEIQGIFRNI